MMKIWTPISLAIVLLPLLVFAQDEMPLGDLARNLRRSKAPQQLDAPLIDNDNLAQATEDAKNRRPVARDKDKDKDKFVLSIDPTAKTIRASSPDVTCSLSF